jgi:hypothetical protein
MGDEQLGWFGGEDDDRPHAPEPSSDDEPPARPLPVDQRALNIVGIEQARIALTAGRAAARRQPHPHPQVTAATRPALGDLHLHQKVQAVRRTCLRRTHDGWGPP